jgi:hypothetical protein
MTNEKALKMFRAGIEATECEVKKDLYQTAISALEKQIPKKAIPCSLNSTWTKCPVCGDTYIDEYCGKCGQQLDWGD